MEKRVVIELVDLLAENSTKGPPVFVIGKKGVILWDLLIYIRFNK